MARLKLAVQKKNRRDCRATGGAFALRKNTHAGEV